MKTGNLKYCACFFVACATLTTSDLALAGPPFITDDPETVEYQHHEFYISSQQVNTRDGRSWTLPHFEFNYGAAPDLQLHIIAPYAFNNPVDGPRQRGLGDVELGAKYRFMQETDNCPMVGIFPIVVTHTGDADKGLAMAGLKCSYPSGCKRNGAPGKVTAAAVIGSTAPARTRKPLVLWLAAAKRYLGAP